MTTENNNTQNSNGSQIKNIFSKYIRNLFPEKQTNIFWLIFNGIQESLDYLDNKINIYKRERNILTATSMMSLRSLASNNGFEPVLKTASKGVVGIKVHPKLFNRVGFPLYLPPYSKLKNKSNNLTYFYDSNKLVKLENDIVYIPVTEGEFVNKTVVSKGEYVERFYLDSDSISDGSINIMVNNIKFTEVKSFLDNDHLYDGKQFIVKYSNKLTSPIVIYVIGLNVNDIVQISYVSTFGEIGNFNYNCYFDTENIINKNGDSIDISNDEIDIQNISGFNFGSDGSDINTLRSAIGFNHGVELLFDSLSYSKYLLKYSNVNLQKILLNQEKKSINNIYISKKQYINTNLKQYIKDEYNKILINNEYLFSDIDMKTLSSNINNNEFALSSHNLFHSEVNKYIIQIKFNNKYNLDNYGVKLEQLIYEQFSKFLYDKYYILNMEILFNDFMKQNKIIFSYSIFNEEIETIKLLDKKPIETPYIIKHDNKLPLLSGGFNISTNNFEPLKIIEPLNIVYHAN